MDIGTFITNRMWRKLQEGEGPILRSGEIESSIGMEQKEMDDGGELNVS